MPIDALKHGRWYWLHAEGPDGRVVILARYMTNFWPRFMLPGEACTAYRFTDGWVHKWRVRHIEAVVVPPWRDGATDAD